MTSSASLALCKYRHVVCVASKGTLACVFCVSRRELRYLGRHASYVTLSMVAFKMSFPPVSVESDVS